MMRFATLATACTVATCAAACAAAGDRFAFVGSGEERERAAARHTQLSLAYLADARLAVAQQEVTAALALAPEAVDVLHAAALVEAAAGRAEQALAWFERAVRAADARLSRAPNGARDIAASPSTCLSTLWSNYAVALLATGDTARAERFSARARCEPVAVQ